MPEKASNPERTKDGADVPEVAVGHCAYHEDFVTLRYHREQVAALTQEVATLKAYTVLCEEHERYARRRDESRR